MIAGYFHEGSGLGNQLHRYVATRILAADLGVDFGMINPWNFKGKSFLNIDMGVPYPTGIPQFDQNMAQFHEREVRVDRGGERVDVRAFDPEIWNVKDNTVIDGEFQDEWYFRHRIDEVNSWLTVEPMDVPKNECVIGFRGGEYSLVPSLFLTQEYWIKAIDMMKKIRKDMTFRVVTDDPIRAAQFFPHFTISHDIGHDWRSIRYAPYLIIANSSFYIFPSLLNERVKKVIAPKYWARRNTGIWALPQNRYEKFTYI